MYYVIVISSLNRMLIMFYNTQIRRSAIPIGTHALYKLGNINSAATLIGSHFVLICSIYNTRNYRNSNIKVSIRLLVGFAMRLLLFGFVMFLTIF